MSLPRFPLKFRCSASHGRLSCKGCWHTSLRYSWRKRWAKVFQKNKNTSWEVWCGVSVSHLLKTCFDSKTKKKHELHVTCHSSNLHHFYILLRNVHIQPFFDSFLATGHCSSFSAKQRWIQSSRSRANWVKESTQNVEWNYCWWNKPDLHQLRFGGLSYYIFFTRF